MCFILESLTKKCLLLQIKYAALADVRIVKQSKSDAVKAVSNEVNQTPKGDDDKNAAIIKMSSINDNKENVSKDTNPGLLSSFSVLKQLIFSTDATIDLFAYKWVNLERVSI